MESIRLRLDVSYDGADFSGWAAQPARRTVAGVLTEALGLSLRVASVNVRPGKPTFFGVLAGQVTSPVPRKHAASKFGQT